MGTRARRLRVLGAAATVVVMVVSCAGGDEQGEAMEMKLGTATTNDIQQALLERFAEVVAETSDGRIHGQVFTGGQLGGNQQMLELVQSGGLEATMQPSGFYAAFVPEFGVLELPFLFDDAEQRDDVLSDEDAMRPFNEAAAEKGMHILFHFSSIEGYQGIVSRAPVTTVDDLKGRKIRYFGAEEQAEAFEAWGAGPVAMPLPEVYTSLQQGTIDATAFALETYAAGKFYEVAPYFIETRHSALILNLTVSQVWFDSLPPELQEAVVEAGEQVEEELPELRAEFTQRAAEEVEQADGAEVIELPDAEVERLRQLVQPIRDEVAADPVKGEFLQALTGGR